MKNNERELMHLLMHTAAIARRHPENRSDADRGQRRKPGRGYGRILDTLSLTEGVSQIEIARILDIRPQSVSEALSGMEEKGLVIRQPDQNDRRGARIFLTEKGEERREEIARQKEAWATVFFSVLSAEEKEELTRLLSKICVSHRK